VKIRIIQSFRELQISCSRSHIEDRREDDEIHYSKVIPQLKLSIAEINNITLFKSEQ